MLLDATYGLDEEADTDIGLDPYIPAILLWCEGRPTTPRAPTVGFGVVGGVGTGDSKFEVTSFQYGKSLSTFFHSSNDFFL